jgi:hypothetical protein
MDINYDVEATDDHNDEDVTNGELDDILESIADAIASPQRIGDQHLAEVFSAATKMARDIIEPDAWFDYTIAPGAGSVTASRSSECAAVATIRFYHRGGLRHTDSQWHRAIYFLEVMHVYENPRFYIDHLVDGDMMVQLTDANEARSLVNTYLDTHDKHYCSTQEMALLAGLAEVSLHEQDEHPFTAYVTASSFPKDDPRYVAPAKEPDRFHLYVLYEACALYVKFENTQLLDLSRALEAMTVPARRMLN